MNVNCEKLQNSLKNLSKLNLVNNDFSKFLRLNEFSESDVNVIFQNLGEKLLQKDWTVEIAKEFEGFLLQIVSNVIPLNENINDFIEYQNKCVILSKLINISSDILEYSLKYFSNKPAPFQNFYFKTRFEEKRRKNNYTALSNKEIIKCCYDFITAETDFFKEIWDWSTFLEKYFNKGDFEEQIYCNNIVAKLTCMTESQLCILNSKIPLQFLEAFDENENNLFIFEKILCNSNDDSKVIKWKLPKNGITNIEGVLLPIYNEKNFNYFESSKINEIIKVNSTKINIRNIAIGISSRKPICVSGPVGCGKTTLIEYLAKQTGRVCSHYCDTLKTNEIKEHEINGIDGENLPINMGILREKKRKNTQKENNNDFLERNGFLRIQLGDQTDSKMLLGQYHCTDVPGEFIWSPGVLTQAVMGGLWLLLEDIDLGTQDTITILCNLLETKSLNVPGFRDFIKIAPGFQLFVTLRTVSSMSNAQKSFISLLNKYLYTVNIIPLSKEELSYIVSQNFSNLKEIAFRMVDMYLHFSNNNHFDINNEIINTKEVIVSENTNLISNSFQSTSERLVSTRDFMKLCQRSDPTFSKTSTECAFFIFQNAVDIFCSHLPQGSIKTNLIVSVGSKLGINPSRCEHYANEYKPDVTLNDFRIKIGRTELRRKSKLNSNRNLDEELLNKKRFKLSNTTEKEISLSTNVNNKPTDTFSFTRISVCLLERISVCINQNEPVLLVGETGVGKTSSIHYLATQTNHRLIVVNMNNQSDVSDLIGGFKPVDLSYVVAPIRQDFENLFRKTFNETKNEKFLCNISICYNQGNFDIIIKLILKIVDSVFEKVKLNQHSVAQKILDEWIILHKKATKLYSQLQKSANISFAFIPGALVNCIQSGDWILLDELNLASAETLECLSTILEPSGSIILLERGDFSPVRRHPNFRIFACMNPNTDIGKKDLPTGIRNRFTEFFVDELITDYDLTLLINDYLINTGIKKIKISNIVKLYKKLRFLSQLELNDGLGNRPVYSLRNLCRALRICSKNLCGSIERNLYESLCLSFLTQLDIVSHKVVLHLITENIIGTNSKAILAQSMPKLGEHFLNFEGYWIEQGMKKKEECNYYILTESVQQNLKDLARIISIGKLPILLQGPTSAGKTSLIEYIAKKSGNTCLRVNNHEHTDLQEYIGTYVSDITGKLSFKEGVLVQAMRKGYWIILDELNLASSDILEALNRVLDDNRELFIPETQIIVKAHTNFMLFATQNPPGIYGGRKTLSRAFKNRFVELHFSEIPSNELEVILEKRCFIPKSYSQKMVKCMNELQSNRKMATIKNNFTLRDLFRWGNRYTFANKKLLEDNSYDWNQHLIDEGYLVLSGKVRTNIEEEIIRDALKKYFKKSIDPKKLFDYNCDTSMVTKEILQSLHEFTNRSDIIWTHNMKRMAVLTAKSLQFNEPVLLVGPTGCGKTTICQILAAIKNINLRILNCHMHTEGADFLGGLRPHRSTDEKLENKKPLFEWVDGPLVKSMQDGSYFMADEISLAEDSVLERLNSVLEPERKILLAEKGGIDENSIDCEIDENRLSEFVIQAKNNFQFLATMNPGGDFGKKELSPALRNRFTEIWCKPSTEYKDLVEITSNMLNISKNEHIKLHQQIATVLVKAVFHIEEKIDKFKFSVRDILAWVSYILKNSENKSLQLEDLIIFGLETIFLDSLEMLCQESLEIIDTLKESIIDFVIKEINTSLHLNTTVNIIQNKRGNSVELNENQFGIRPFYIEAYDSSMNTQNTFFFEAPTTHKNLFRILSALSLQKAILLEGPPGVGKTSIIENLAKEIGYKIVRINLCEHTDLSDLFGTDLPIEESYKLNDLKESENSNDLKENIQPGSFKWHNGPLLSALISENVWILLDELNLAPQSVLEGLNAILDHRGEVFIPELNKTFKIGKGTRIFACQNPLRQGGGRKGLPQSFLNRFTKVYLRKLNSKDLLYVINNRYENNFKIIMEYFQKYLNSSTIIKELNFFDISKLKKTNSKDFEIFIKKYSKLEFDLAKRMVKFSENLDLGITNFDFGYQGGPYEINLRDILRWCDSLFDKNTGFIIPNENDYDSISNFILDVNNFILVLYERMKLIYFQRMRSDQDHLYILNAFSNEFNCDIEELNKISEDVSFYFTEGAIYLNDIIIDRTIKDSEENLIRFQLSSKKHPLILYKQKELLKNIMECVHIEKPVLLCGPVDAGKTKVVDLFSDISNRSCQFDNIDESVTGSFQQIDFNRHLGEISTQVGRKVIKFLQNEFIKEKENSNNIWLLNVCNLIRNWNSYIKINECKTEPLQTVGDAISIFKQRIENLEKVIQNLICILCAKNQSGLEIDIEFLKYFSVSLNELKNIVNSEKLNSGGYFEWIDSKIVKCLKNGEYICLEHANLCSSAVLDRLNSVFEPNGQLLISEKGIACGHDAEIVEKHQNFRVFLTIDPKNGELSRAMRNRCIEIALRKDSYSDCDLKKIIILNGIIKSNCIEAILNMYKEVKILTDFSNFNVSHLVQMAFLAAAYNKIGVDDVKSIYLAGMDIFVNSSKSDLMGYGLEFYHNKLQEIVIQASSHIKNTQIRKVNFNNIILTSKNLNSLSLVKLQLEPFSILLNNFENYENAKSDLSFLFDEIDSLEFTNNELLLKFYMFIVYQISKNKDIKYRFYIIEKLLNKYKNKLPVAIIQDLLQLNKNLLIEFEAEMKKNHELFSNDLPWNMKIFPRIRTYRKLTNLEIHKNFESKLTGILLYSVLIETLPNETKLNLKENQVTAYNYSYGVYSKLINDKTNNVFILNLYIFIKEFKKLLKVIVENVDNKMENFTEIILKILWLKRYFKISNQKLFEDKNEINIGLLDHLYLHFKWICKKILLNNKNECNNFNNIYNLLNNYLSKSTTNLNLLKKHYVKLMTNFNIPDSLEQIQFNEICNKFDQVINLIPYYGNFDTNTILLKHEIISNEESGRIKLFFLNKNCNLFMNKIRRDSSEEIYYELNTNNIKTKSEEILNQFYKNQLECNYTNDEIDFDTLIASVNNLNTLICSNDYKVETFNVDIFNVELFPLKEYYLNNIYAYLNKNNNSILNPFYMKSLKSLKLKDINVLNIITTEEYRNFNNMWSNLIDTIIKQGDLNDFFNDNKHLIKLSCYSKYSTFDHLIQNSIKLFKLSNLKLKPESCFDLLHINEINNDITYKGPYLINILNKILLKSNGELRQISIKELPKWENQLKYINEIFWFNSNLLHNPKTVIENFESSIFDANKLILEIKFIFQRIQKNNPKELITDNYENFNNLTEKLMYYIEISENINKNLNSDYNLYDIIRLEQITSFVYSLIGCIQLNLITFMPLVDPIEKNSFKKKYIDEDFIYLKSLSNAYDILSIAMEYKNLGAEYRSEINKKLEQLSKKREKYLGNNLQKRPESHLYSKMIQDVKHYLNSNCKVNQLLSIISKVENCFKPENDKFSLQQEIGECIKIIKVWILNSQQFLQQILKKYPSYQEDIIQPIECAIIMTRYGFENLKKNLVQNRSSITFEMENQNLDIINLYQILEELIKYPNTEILSKNTQNKLFNILERLDSNQYENLHIKILKSKIYDILSSANTSSEFNSNLFLQFDDTLKSINKIWKHQEEIKKIKEIEDENLYVIKTKCENENEEEDDLNTIQELFPTTVNDDFSEFLEINSLENNSTIPQVNQNKCNSKNLFINENEFHFVAENFMEVLETYSKTSYYISNSKSKLQISLKHNHIFNDRMQIFQTVFDIYKSSLNEIFDSKVYNTFRLLIKLHQNQIMNTDNKTIVNKNIYNIYKDSNIPEINSCVSLLEKIEKRTNIQLELYPDHATLIDILKVVTRINSFTITSPIVRFNTGFQLLRQKLAQWNEVAHKNNHMQDLEISAAEFVQHWTKLELQFWRNCLFDAKEKVETSAYKYWFFMYNLIHEFLISEKKNESDELASDNTELQLTEIKNILKQFLKSSNYGDFLIRLKLLKSFELYLNFWMSLQSDDTEKQKLIAVMYNIRIYYEQFSIEIEEFKKNLLTTVEKKLKELVKIESFNKDLSYFSMKNNIARVHRNLNKFIKEYRNGLKESISKVFEYKENDLYDLNSINDKGGKNLRNDPKVKYYMIDAKHFIALDKFKYTKCDLNDEVISNSSLHSISKTGSNRLEKLFLISRNISKQIISNVEYPNLTSNLEGLLSNYFETYEYLHNLNIDRNLEKSKQIAQNKNFIQQKRKALSDVFKTLTILGINYRTGLMEKSINSEFINFKINPFSIDILLLNVSKSKTLHQSFTYLNENINLYYSKCIYNIKILQNNLINPNSELGSANIERIKGFSIDMFILVQNQRNLLSSSVNWICKLRTNMMNLIKLIKYSQQNNYNESNLNFIQLENQLLFLKEIFNKINIFFTQFKSILDTIPLECNNENYVLENNETIFTKDSEKYNKIINKCDEIMQISEDSLMELKNLSTLQPLDYEVIQKLLSKKEKCVKLIENLQSEFSFANGYSSITNSLHDLLNRISEANEKYERNTENESIEIDVNTINIEIENIVHISLIAIQNLFKKYNVDDKIQKENKNKLNILGESEIYTDHLKEKIFKEITADFLILNIQKLCSKVENVYLAIKHLNHKSDTIRKISIMLPILHQYSLLGFYYLLQQLGSHKVSVKILYVMLSAFIELTSKGFCSPPDLIQDEDGQQKESNSKNEGGGFTEDNTTGNEKDVSEKIENEDQLDDAKRPEDRKNDKEQNQQDCKEEKGIEMSDNFDADLQDIEKEQDENKDNSDEDDDQNDLDKEMGDTEHGGEKLDDQIWGSDNENDNESEDENEMTDDEFSKDCEDEDDTHNDLNSKNEKSKKDEEFGENDEQLDAVDNREDNPNVKKQTEKNIDDMKEPEIDEEQTNAYHNELEEPPEAEDMQLDENVNLDENADKDKDPTNDTDNPFDIDKMKDTMELDEQPEEDMGNDDKNDDNVSQDDVTDSDEDDNNNLKCDEEKQQNDKVDDNAEQEIEDNNEQMKEVDDVEKYETETPNEEQNADEKEIDELFEESKDKSTKEENVQSNETDEAKGSNDNVQDVKEKNVQQEQKLDDQETGDDGKGVGQANDDQSEKGHQSIAETTEIDTIEKQADQKDSKMKNKPQKPDENRILGEQNDDTLKNLKTIDKNKSKKDENEEEQPNESGEKEKDLKAEEYQHIKNPENSKVTAIDNATEEQIKQIQHISDEEEQSENDEKIDESNENPDFNENNLNENSNSEDDAPKLKPEKNQQKSNEPKLNEINDEQDTINKQKMEVEGEDIETYLPLRNCETTAHVLKNNLTTNSVHEPTDMEILEMKKLYYDQLGNTKTRLPHTEDFEIWQTISSLMQSNARELCEQLRLILEPTKCTKLKGDYKTGRRINMKKIIPYIASQFRKDKIWLRRTKPSQRDYKITIAIDDSKSMHHNNSKEITLKAISLVSQALTLLESGKLNILSFGESPQIILNHTEQFNGPKLVNSLNFDQNQSRIAELLDFIRTLNAEEGNTISDNRLFENLLLILSDGRNIFSEGEQKVKNSVKLAKLQRIFIVYIIIDNPENKHSILDIRVPNFSLDKKTISMKSYLDTFPFPYYVIVRDLDQLPLVLSEAMRQWFELVNSEQ